MKFNPKAQEFVPSPSSSPQEHSLEEYMMEGEEYHFELTEQDIEESMKYLTAEEAAELDEVDEWVQTMAELEEEEIDYLQEYALRAIHGLESAPAKSPVEDYVVVQKSDIKQ